LQRSSWRFDERQPDGMKTATKKWIAGVSLLAGLVTLMAGFAHSVPFGVSLVRAMIATAGFGLASFVGGLAYEKLWLK